MCRLFGFRSNIPAPVHGSLLSAANSLRKQSVEHKDGWGIAYYGDAERPIVSLGIDPAHRDPEFERVSGLLASHAVLAHVRLASVGEVHARNTHPFVFGRWAFAHNGTVRGFAHHQDEIESAIAPHLREQLRGTTDSERCFYLFLTFLEGDGGLRSPPIDAVARALGRTVRFVIACTEREDGKPTSTNFLVTDGALMVATRHERTLFFSDARGRSERGIPPREGEKLKQWVVASEELSGEDHWHPVPEDSVIGVTSDLVLRTWTLAEVGGENWVL